MEGEPELGRCIFDIGSFQYLMYQGTCRYATGRHMQNSKELKQHEFSL